MIESVVVVVAVIGTVTRWMMVMGLWHVWSRACGRFIIADNAAIIVCTGYGSERVVAIWICQDRIKFHSTANNIAFAAEVDTDVSLCLVYKHIRDCSYVADAATGFVLVG